MKGCTISSLYRFAGGITGSNNNLNNGIAACLAKEVNVIAGSYLGGITGLNTYYAAIIGSYAHLCTQGEDEAPLEGDANIAGYNSATITECYYHSTGESGAFWTYSTGTTGSDWTGAITDMNTAIKNYSYEWTGDSADNAEIKKKN